MSKISDPSVYTLCEARRSPWSTNSLASAPRTSLVPEAIRGFISQALWHHLLTTLLTRTLNTMSTTIEVGATIPEAEFPTVYWSEELESGAACGVPSKLSTKEWEGKKVVVVAVPGAFTPTCHVNHIPGYVKNHQAIKDKGVDQIVVIAANDPFVMSGWGRINGAKGDVLFVTDTYVEWSKKLGLSVDLTGHGLGIRTSRYALLIDNKKVAKVLVEPNPGALAVTSAEQIIAAIDELGWKK
ncbi:unnamed protein product [Rhizoctonia solani]|uniref:Putative peroxiredoxin n=1 Tax=Rhizoctonia solani TaxID=456999 RepID=A0A8H2W9N4_9AGAM|nr:unnamed protein product [Rhizoctonia solani]